MARKPCLEPGCRAFAKPGRPRCINHDKQWRGARWEHPDFKRWGKPSGPCRLRMSPNCNGIADTWHHIDGDSTNHHITNRMGACRSCNSAERGTR